MGTSTKLQEKVNINVILQEYKANIKRINRRIINIQIVVQIYNLNTKIGQQLIMKKITFVISLNKMRSTRKHFTNINFMIDLIVY